VATAQGRFYNDDDNAQARNVAFLGSDTKKQLFAEREALGQTIWMNGIPYTVIGIMKSKEQNSSYDGFDTRKIFIPFSAMRRDFPNKPPPLNIPLTTCLSLHGPLKLTRIASASCAAPSPAYTITILAMKKRLASGTP